VRWARTLACALLLSACGADSPEPRPGPSHQLTSSAGGWVLSWTSDPSELPLNETFDLHIRVRAPDGALPPEGLELAVDAAMPQHQHGMNRRAELQPRGRGEWLARGLLFHMPGQWQIYFDITHAGVTERAQCPITLD